MTPLSDTEREGIVIAVQSVFRKLTNLYAKVVPIFQSYGFTAQSAGVVARDISEKIEIAIAQHCDSFSKGIGHSDLRRDDHDWEVKVCKGRRLTINQSKTVRGEHYIVVNYTDNSRLDKIWVLWNADDSFFSPRQPNLNLRTIVPAVAQANIQTIFENGALQFDDANAPPAKAARLRMAKANGARKARIRAAR